MITRIVPARVFRYGVLPPRLEKGKNAPIHARLQHVIFTDRISDKLVLQFIHHLQVNQDAGLPPSGVVPGFLRLLP
jgi:hypothetical protein